MKYEPHNPSMLANGLTAGRYRVFCHDQIERDSVGDLVLIVRAGGKAVTTVDGSVCVLVARWQGRLWWRGDRNLRLALELLLLKLLL